MRNTHVWALRSDFPQGNKAFSMAYPRGYLRPAQVRPKREAFLLEDLADKSLRGPQNPRNTRCLALRQDFPRENKAFSRENKAFCQWPNLEGT